MVNAASDASGEVLNVAIKGLHSHQCEDLEDIQVGSLLEVVAYVRVLGSSSPQSSEVGDGSDVEEGGEESEGRGSEGEESEAEEPDTPSATDATSTTAKLNADISGDPGGPVRLHENGDGASGAGEKDTSANGLSGTKGLGSTDAVVDAVGVTDAQVSLVDRLFSVPDGQATDHPPITVASDSGDDAGRSDVESNIEENEGESGSDEQGGEDDEDNEDEEDEEDESRLAEVERDLFVVLSLVKDSHGTITDVHLRRLAYQERGESADYDTYRIYGNAIALEDEAATLQDGEDPESLVKMTSSSRDRCEARMVASNSDKVYAFTLDPSADHLRRTIFDSACPAECVNGWLPSQTSLHELVSDDLETLQHFRPLCPVCMGKDLMNEQLLLRSLMDTTHVVDIGMVVEYLGRLNPRRRQLGYSFVQFDERQWGYGFDDMLDEDDSEREEEERFEQWDEAMDPNANPKTRPASKDTVAKLPRKKYADVVKKEDGAACAICQGPFEEGSDVVDLPCRHVYDAACLEVWIKQYDSCPECRSTVSGMVVDLSNSAPVHDEANTTAETGAAAQTSTAQAQTAHPQGDGDAEPPALMDGEDTIMNDAIPE